MKKNISRREALKAIGLTMGTAAIGTQGFSQIGEALTGNRPRPIPGANNLSIDEKTIVVPEHLTRIADAYDKKGMNVLTIPAKDTIEYGSGPRCLTAILRRDP